MGTLAEHTAAIEFYRANYDEREAIRSALDMELWLLATTHLKEVAAMCRPDGLEAAREAFAAKLRANYGAAAEPFIARWQATLTGAQPAPAPQPADSAMEVLRDGMAAVEQWRSADGFVERGLARIALDKFMDRARALVAKETPHAR